jgi:hypothetical protein
LTDVVAPDSLHALVQRVLTLLRAELDELAGRKAELERRKRKLLRLRYSLLAGALRSPAFGAGSLKSPRQRKRVERAKSNARKSRRQHKELTRACRIAFLDAGGSATPDQIYWLIVRRRSFSFIDLDEEPASAIARTLHLMAETGEATCITNDPNSCWRLLTTEPTGRQE